MVRRHLKPRGVTDRRVLAAMAWVPREMFVPEPLRAMSYDDSPLPVAGGQTISQPFIVAWMTQYAALTRTSRVLEIGTGTGYQTAILAKIAGHVWSIDRVAELTVEAAPRLAALGIRNVTLRVGDGALGWPEAAPFDTILIGAASPVPPPFLLDQLAPGGRMILPLGGPESQELTVVERSQGGFKRLSIGACRFVPFVSPALHTSAN
jgi:protein-L-isoaspartate(D-aspartate) O-methyltransferase